MTTQPQPIEDPGQRTPHDAAGDYLGGRRVTTCPRCNAHGDDPCLTTSGKLARTIHVDRLRVTRTPGALEEAIRAAVDEAFWLTSLYAPAVDSALIIARKVDDAVWTAEQSVRGSLFADHALGRLEGGIVYDLQTLHTLLTSLGLTPKGRGELGLTEMEDDDELAAVLELYSD